MEESEPAHRSIVLECSLFQKTASGAILNNGPEMVEKRYRCARLLSSISKAEPKRSTILGRATY